MILKTVSVSKVFNGAFEYIYNLDKDSQNMHNSFTRLRVLIRKIQVTTGMSGLQMLILCILSCSQIIQIVHKLFANNNMQRMHLISLNY